MLSYTSKESIETTVKDSHSISSSGTFNPRIIHGVCLYFSFYMYIIIDW